jgi:hypothetical protein
MINKMSVIFLLLASMTMNYSKAETNSEQYASQSKTEIYKGSVQKVTGLNSDGTKKVCYTILDEAGNEVLKVGKKFEDCGAGSVAAADAFIDELEKATDLKQKVSIQVEGSKVAFITRPI